MWLLLLVVAVPSVAVPSVASEASFQILGSGTTHAAILFYDWFYAYSFLKPDVHFTYDSTGSGTGIQALVAKTVQFAGTDRPLTTQEAESYPYLQVFPINSFAIVPQVNLPFLSASQQLVLDLLTLTDIYSGNITSWSDPRIVATNPGVVFPSLPGNPIKVVYRNDSSGTTFQLTSLFSAVSPDWKDTWGPISQFPSNITGKPNYLEVNSQLLGMATTMAIPYTIFYLSYGYLTKLGLPTSYALLIDRFGKNITASSETVQTASSTVVLDSSLGAVFVDPNISNAWPISTFSYFVINKRPPASDCATYRELYKFFNWILSSGQAADADVEDGFTELPISMRLQVLGQLEEEVFCNGSSVPLLAVQEVDPHGIATIILEVISVCVFVFVLICNFLNFYYYRTPLINIIYSFVFLIGAVFALISPLFWLRVPRDPHICSARLWLTSLGLSIVLGTMFSRTWQLNQIYTYRRSTSAMRKNVNQRTALIKLTMVLCTILTVNLVILILWQSIDPFTNVYYLSNSLDLLGEWKCTSHHMIAWVAVETIFFVSILLWGLYVIFKTWTFRQALLSETRWVFLALYNVILNIAALGPILSEATLNDNNLAMAVVISIDFSVGGIAIAVLLPRIIKKTIGVHRPSALTQGGTPKKKKVSLRNIQERRDTIISDNNKGSMNDTENGIPDTFPPEATVVPKEDTPEELPPAVA